MSLIAIIRIRGKVKVNYEIEDTLKMLNLTRNNHMSIFKDSKALEGMLHKVKDYVTWGNINKETLVKVLKKRGRLVGNKRITEKWLKEHNLTLEKIADLFENDPKEVYALGIKKVFRLTPPSKGFERKGIKVPYSVGGVLGNRKEKINELIEKMI